MKNVLNRNSYAGPADDISSVFLLRAPKEKNQIHFESDRTEKFLSVLYFSIIARYDSNFQCPTCALIYRIKIFNRKCKMYTGHREKRIFRAFSKNRIQTPANSDVYEKNIYSHRWSFQQAKFCRNAQQEMQIISLKYYLRRHDTLYKVIRVLILQ